jgi:hypothetical protein
MYTATLIVSKTNGNNKMDRTICNIGVDYNTYVKGAVQMTVALTLLAESILCTSLRQLTLLRLLLALSIHSPPAALLRSRISATKSAFVGPAFLPM